VKVTRIESPKALKFEVVVPAKLDDVWTAFTTNDGLNTWLWQDCTVDLRNGGGWTVHYPGPATGGGTIISFQPKRQLVIHAMAPEKFPEVRATGTTATFDFRTSRRKDPRHPDPDRLEAGQRVGRRLRLSGRRQRPTPRPTQLPLRQRPHSLAKEINSLVGRASVCQSERSSDFCSCPKPRAGHHILKYTQWPSSPSSLPHRARSPPHSTLIRNARVIDGSGNP
jgi:uncharacterized protein YndB with AHSA1/START domain